MLRHGAGKTKALNVVLARKPITSKMMFIRSINICSLVCSSFSSTVQSWQLHVTNHKSCGLVCSETSSLKHWPPETICVDPSPLNLSSESLSLSLLSSTNRDRHLFDVKGPTDAHVSIKNCVSFLEHMLEAVTSERCCFYTWKWKLL